MSAPQAWMLRGACASDDPAIYLTCKDLWRHFAGPLGFGLIISCTLFGAIVVLSIQFFASRPRNQEKATIWWSALVAVLLTIAATGVEYYGHFTYFVVNGPSHTWDVGMVPFIPPLHVSLAIGMLATAISQFYFGSRAYLFVARYQESLGHDQRMIKALGIFCVSMLIIANCAGVVLMIISGYIDYGKVARSGIDAFLYSGGMPEESILRMQQALYGLWVCGSAGIDVIYTSVLCTRLATDRRESAFQRTSLTLGKVFAFSLTTSSVTTLCAVLAMFLYYCYSIGTVHLFFMTILPKLYVLCYFFTLNTRKNLADTLNGKSSGTFNLQQFNTTGSSGSRPGVNVSLPNPSFTRSIERSSEKHDF